MADRNYYDEIMVMPRDRCNYNQGDNPTCTNVPKTDVLKSIVERGYVPFDMYLQLVQAGKNEQEVTEYCNALVELATKRTTKDKHDISPATNVTENFEAKPANKDNMNRTWHGQEAADLEARVAMQKAQRKATIAEFCNEVLNRFARGG
jgi:hypothetical protein